MDIIRIDNLEVYAYHGVYDEEKEKGQYFMLMLNYIQIQEKLA